MNPYYHYKYSNGLQFVSQASFPLLKLALTNKNIEIPKLIGIWRFKEIKRQKIIINKPNTIISKTKIIEEKLKKPTNKNK